MAGTLTDIVGAEYGRPSNRARAPAFARDHGVEPERVANSAALHEATTDAVGAAQNLIRNNGLTP